MNTPKIRPATAEDLDQVLQLEQASATAPHWSAADYAGILKPQTGLLRRCLFVAHAESADPALLGFAVGRLVGVEAELESVAVHAAAQRQGLGTALCQAVAAWATAAGACSIGLEVRAHSLGALRLYAGLGFVAVGRRVAYYSSPIDDAVLMRRDLPQEPAPARPTDPVQGLLDV